MKPERGVILLHTAFSEGGNCVYCGAAQPWPDMDPCNGPEPLRTEIARLGSALMRAGVRVPLTDEQIDALVREFDISMYIADLSASIAECKNVAHKGFRDLVLTARTERKNRLVADDLLRSLAYNGCFTGDCPHTTTEACMVALSQLAGEALSYLTTPSGGPDEGTTLAIQASPNGEKNDP